jgi:hypothetical protein
MANRFTPTVLPRAPSLSIFQDELTATRNRPTTLQRLGSALNSFENIGRFFTDRGVRRSITDEQEQGENENFGAALGRAATASLDSRRAGTAVRGEPGVSTRLGSFDSGSGRFLRPDDNVQVQQVEQRSGLGASDRGLVSAPPGPSSEVDEQIRRRQRLFGDPDELIAQREQGQKLAQAISILRRAGASQEEIGLVQAGIVEPGDIFNEIGKRRDEEDKEAQQRAAFQQLHAADPVRYPEFLPSFDYDAEIAARTDDLRSLDQERFEQEAQTGRTTLIQDRTDRRADLRRSDTQGTVSPQMKSNARGMVRNGLTKNQVVDQLVRSGATLEDAFEEADAAIADVTGKPRTTAASGATRTPAEHLGFATELEESGIESRSDPAVLATLSDPRLGFSAKDQEAILDILEDKGF